MKEMWVYIVETLANFFYDVNLDALIEIFFKLV